MAYRPWPSSHFRISIHGHTSSHVPHDQILGFRSHRLEGAEEPADPPHSSYVSHPWKLKVTLNLTGQPAIQN